MYFINIEIEIKKTADPQARSFEAYYYAPILICHHNTNKPVIIETSISTRSLKSAAFRSIVLANELSDSVDPIIKMYDEYMFESIIESQELLSYAFGKYTIKRDDVKSLNEFSLGKKIMKKEINE